MSHSVDLSQNKSRQKEVSDTQSNNRYVDYQPYAHTSPYDSKVQYLPRLYHFSDDNSKCYNKIMSKEEIKVVPKVFDTYISMVENSVGSKAWQTVWADVDGKKTDVTMGGVKSCAFFVSSILKNFDFIKKTHATVASTTKDLKESGWVSIESPRAGAVIVYEPVVFDDGESNEHIAICVSDTKAVSNSYTKRVPVIHDIEMVFDDKPRKITHILFNDSVNTNGVK